MNCHRCSFPVARRKFLRGLAGAAGAVAGLSLLREFSWADDLPSDVTITRIVGFNLPTRRRKLVGKNSRRDLHGDRSSDRMIRVYASNGVDGLGACRANKKTVEKLLGTNPFGFFQDEPPEFRSPLGAGTMPLWDLAGKLLGKPVFDLLGGAGPQSVSVYDGSIYFIDLLPQYAKTWRDRFKREIDMGLASGHRAFKLKIGRGAKWMPRADGDRRDEEVVGLVREHGGADVEIGVDANNGYDLCGAKQFLRGAGEFQIAFAEEMFPETVDDCLAFKSFIAEHGWNTLVADGETQRKLDAFKPLIEARAIEVLQGDMKHFGFEGIMTEAAWARPKKILIAPHNWGSLIGYYMQLHVGRAISNFYKAEHDPLHTNVLVADGYGLKDGRTTVPDTPGFGLQLNEEQFRREIKVDFDLKA